MLTYADPVAGSIRQNLGLDVVSPTDFFNPNTFKLEFTSIKSC